MKVLKEPMKTSVKVVAMSAEIRNGHHSDMEQGRQTIDEFSNQKGTT
jgi:hypothetical protein